MSSAGTRFVICYDVPDDRRRTRISKHLDAFGDRVQYSVFEGRFPPPIFDEVLEGLLDLIDSDEDSIVIYGLCATCASKVLRLGCNETDTPPGDEEVFLA